MHAPSSDWVFLLHCHQFRKPLMEKINPDTQTRPLCLFTWCVIIATHDLHPANIFSPSPNYGPPLPTATGTAGPGRPAGSLPQRHKPGSCWGEAASSPDLSQPFPRMEINTQTSADRLSAHRDRELHGLQVLGGPGSSSAEALSAHP